MPKQHERSEPGPTDWTPIKWNAIQTETFTKAIVGVDESECENCILVAFYFDEKSQLDQTLPYWLVFSQGQKYQRDNASFMHILSDTLMEYQPRVSLSFNKSSKQQKSSRVKGNLTRLLHSGELTTVKKGDREYYLWMYISLDQKYVGQVPPDICNISLQINSQSLPLDRYMYGHCLKFDARYLNCPFNQYLRLGGTPKNNKGVGKDTCRVFRLDKGSPHIYCSFLLGT